MVAKGYQSYYYYSYFMITYIEGWLVFIFVEVWSHRALHNQSCNCSWQATSSQCICKQKTSLQVVLKGYEIVMSLQTQDQFTKFPHYTQIEQLVRYASVGRKFIVIQDTVKF